MPNEYFSETGVPGDVALVLSAPVRAEFSAVASGFNLFAPIAGNANEILSVNSAANALETITSATYKSRISTLDANTKDASGGYVGLTGYKINFKNGSIVSLLQNSNTGIRTYTFPDKSGTVKISSDIHNNKRNVIINGNFNIWQRGTSQTATGYGSDDRWTNERLGTTVTHSRQEFTLGQTDVSNNPRYYSRSIVTTSAGAGNYARKQQKIENVRTFGGEQVVLTFWAKADDARNIAVEMVQSFGTGGAPSADVTGIGAQLVALTTSWQKFVVHISVPSVAGKTLGTTLTDEYEGNNYLGLIFWFDAGSSFDSRTSSLGQQTGIFSIAQIQLEKGVTETDFEAHDYAFELKLCQRYYQKGLKILFSGKVVIGNTYRAKVMYITETRAFPTVVLTAEGNTGFPAGTTFNSTNITTKYLRGEKVADSNSNTGILQNDVVVDAEL